MPSDSYPYAIGRVKIIENALLDHARLQRLSELALEDAVKQLSDWGYAAEFPVKDDVDAMIDFRLGEIRDLVREVSPDMALTNLFWLSLDAINLKYLIKARMLKQGEVANSELEQGVFALDVLRRCVSEGDYTPLGQPLADDMTRAEQLLTTETNPRKLSALVDNAIYAHIFSVLGAKHNEFCVRYFKAKIDFTNIVSVFRAKALSWDTAELSEMLVRGGDIPADRLRDSLVAEESRVAGLLGVGPYADLIKKTLELLPGAGGLTAVAEGFNDALLDLAKDERFDSFGIGPIAYFMLRGEAECRALRVIFARKRAKQR
jgi:V/A-type H+-transporting ATPase subunit C